MNMDKILNELIASLLTNGVAEFSQDGLNIKTSYDNGCLKLQASFVSPEKDDTEEIEALRTSFQEYVKSLSDELFIEVAESFEDGELMKVQHLLDANDLASVKNAVAIFMTHLKKIAAEKVQALNTDIKDAEKELEELIEIRNSYTHVLNKNF